MCVCAVMLRQAAVHTHICWNCCLLITPCHACPACPAAPVPCAFFHISPSMSHALPAFLLADMSVCMPACVLASGAGLQARAGMDAVLARCSGAEPPPLTSAVASVTIVTVSLCIKADPLYIEKYKP